MKIKLHIPSIKDLWFRSQCLNDPETMNYNAGYEVTYPNYDYDTGCIKFYEKDFEKWYNQKMLDSNFYYAYIFDEEINSFVGHLNYKLDTNTNEASIGIVIHSKFRGKGYMRPALCLLFDVAKQNNIKYLVDTVPPSRTSAMKVFYDLGFVKVEEITDIKKFGKYEMVYKIQKTL